MKVPRGEWFLLLFIVLIATIFRLYNLNVVPPCLQFDEAWNATDAERVLFGERPIFLPANGGREVLYTYYQALIARLWGLTPYALRLSSAIVGILTIPLAYFFVKSLFASSAVAIVTTAFVAISYWHVHFSRYGIRSILLPLLITATLYSYWHGVSTRRGLYFLLSGVILGVSFYSHPAVRLWPFILLIFTIYLILSDRAAARDYLTGLFTTGAAAAVIFIPLGRYFWRHQDQFFGHASAVSVFAPRVSGGNVITAILSNTIKVAGMFFVRGDAAWIHNLPNRPVMSWLTAPLFVAGIYLLIRQVFDGAAQNRHAAVLLLIWLGVALVPSVLSDDAPNFSRTIGAIPAVFVPLGLACARIWQWGTRQRWKWLAVIILGLVAIEGGLTWRDYFYRFATAPELYYRYGCDMTDVADFLNRASADNHVYLAPLWAEEGTVAFLTRNHPIKTFESSDTIVLPTDRTGGGAVYVFPLEQEWHVERFAAALGDVARYEVLHGSNGLPLMHVFHIAADDLPTVQDLLNGNYPAAPRVVQPVNFNNELEMLGYTLGEPTHPARSTPVTIYWHSLRVIPANYTVFVHAVDAQGRIWGQQDRWHANATYPTSEWAVGDIVIDSYHPLFDSCTPPGEYKIIVGLYDHRTNKRVPVANSLLTAIELGEVRVKRAKKLQQKDVTPQYIAELELSTARLVGYDLFAEQARAGGQLSINLYWRIVAENPITETVRLELTRDFGVDLAFEPPIKGEYVCNHYDVPLPRDLPAGKHKLLLTGAQSIVLGALEIGATRHNFSAPTPQRALFARAGDSIEFVGYDLTSSATPITPGDTITLTLYWRSAGPADISYTVFVHLLSETGEVRAQHDSPPVYNTRPTNQWVVGEYIADPHVITIPSDAARGTYQIEIGLYDAQTGQRLPIFDAAGRRVPADRILLESTVVEQPRALLSFNAPYAIITCAEGIT